MQERQKIQAQLQRMREECVRDYLQEKLQQITSKEVIHDILKEFLQANNQQFLASIADNIQQAKQQNRALKAQMENLKEQAERRLQQVTEAIHQECEQMHNQEINAIRRQSEAQVTNLRAQIETLKQQNQKFQSQRQQLLANLKEKDKYTEHIQTLKVELAENKRSFANFKQSCEKIIYESNRDRQREKQRLVQEFNKVKLQLESQLKNQKVIEVLENELEESRQKFQRKLEQILQLDKALHNSQSRLLEVSELYSQLSCKYEQIKALETELSIKISDYTRTIQSNELSINYLKQENSYLRAQIQSFNSRYQQVQKEKSGLSRQINGYKSALAKKVQQFESTSQLQKEQFTVTMNQFKSKYDANINQTLAQLTKMKQQVQNYRQLISQKEEQSNILSEKCQNLQQTKLSLQEQINNLISMNQRHQLEAKQYQNEILNIKLACRSEVQSITKTFQTNWNEKNEELIEQQFLNNQLYNKINLLQMNISKLNEQITGLNQDISVKDQKQNYYKMVTEQIKALKKKFCLQKTEQNTNKNLQLTYRFKSKQCKIYFIMRQMQKEIANLKLSNKQLRNLVLTCVGEISTYIQQTTAFIFAKAHNTTLPKLHQSTQHINLKKNLQLKLNVHQKQSNTSKRQESSFDQKDGFFNRTVQQRLNNQTTSNFTQIKKTLKNIQQRYQSVHQQNKFYSTHIDTFIKQA